MKRCSKCQTEKPFEAFARDKYQKNGITPSCKVCRAAKTAQWRLANPDKDKVYKTSEAGRKSARESTARYRRRHPDRVEAYGKSDHAKELHRQFRKRYYDKNVTEENRKFREYYQQNLSKEIKRRRQYYQDNTDKCKTHSQQYAKKNSQLRAFYTAQRRAQKLQATPPWVDKETLLEIYENCPKGFDVDHIVPLQNDRVCGLHVPWNLQIIPAFFNRSKSNKF